MGGWCLGCLGGGLEDVLGTCQPTAQPTFQPTNFSQQRAMAQPQNKVGFRQVQRLPLPVASFVLVAIQRATSRHMALAALQGVGPPRSGVRPGTIYVVIRITNDDPTRRLVFITHARCFKLNGANALALLCSTRNAAWCDGCHRDLVYADRGGGRNFCAHAHRSHASMSR